MSNLLAIAQNTFGRIARQKSLYFLLASCIVIVACMGAYGVLSIGRERVMMLDAALALSLLAGLVTAMGAGFELPHELKSQTAAVILAKALGRVQFVVGKFLGFAALAVFNVAVVSLGSAAVIYAKFGEVPAEFYSGAGLIAGEAVVLTAVAFLLSLLVSEVLAVAGVFVVFAVGHAVHMLPRLFSDGVLAQCGGVVARLLPNLYHLDFKGLIGNGVEVGTSVLVPGLLYALCYSIAMIALAVAIFEHKDIS